MTLSELKKTLMDEGNGLETPALEARVLLSHFGFSPLVQITERDRTVDDDISHKAIDAMKKRVSGYPMAYITGEKEFWGLTFRVNESVLIPRPDTETLVETALSLYRKEIKRGEILDLCTGSGAIATALSVELNKDVFFSDISKDALSVAKENYEGITGRKAEFRQSDLFEEWKGIKFSLIVTNPPYLTEKWCTEVEEEVKKEPYLALYGKDEDGLGIIRKIVEEAGCFLEKDGYIAFECDYRQCSSLKLLLETKGYSSVNIIKDLSGKDRVVYGKYNG